MARSLLFVARASMLAVLLLAPAAAPNAPQLPAGEQPSAAEVRLRKLHLVRPDLIPYPIAYEVCC